MRKIRLDLDDLTVESFGTAQGEETKAGTVRGHDVTQPADGCASRQPGCETYLCISWGTCFQSCGTDYRPCIEPYC